MKRSAIVILLSGFVLLGGCASSPLSLVPGQSTVVDTRERVGRPTDIRFDRNGDELWEFASGPAGQETYVVRLGSDGAVKEVTQVLTEERLMSIVPGKTTKQDVRNLLGRPSDQSFYATGTSWSWRYSSYSGPGYLVVQFNRDNTVRDRMVMLDPPTDDRDKTK